MAIKDDKTPRLGLLLPYTDNFLQDDVERLRQTFDLLDVLVVTRDQTTGKIADDMLSAVIAKLDANGKLLTAQIPGSVVQKGPDGKIDASLMPSIAVVDSFPVPDEASMLGLQCERGDIAIRTDVGKTFILTQMPPSTLSNWRELTTTSVSSVNGKTGAVTGLAASGVNNDITALNALSGPLRLGGDAAGDYDAVTLKQLRAASGGAGGASMNGVMNNFLGAVEWFNGTRAKLPAGHLPADGQILTRAAYPDLWAAINSGMLPSVSDTLWLTATDGDGVFSNRGSYSTGDGSTTFRMPDLNAGYVAQGGFGGTIGGVFLSGPAAGSKDGSNAVVWPSRVPGKLYTQASPEIAGTMTDRATINAQGTTVSNNLATTGAYQVTTPTSGATIAYKLDTAAPTVIEKIDFSAKRADGTYGKDGKNLNPNTAVGIWLIRVSGLFSATGTEFQVLNSDAAMPAVNTYVEGGYFTSQYQVAGKTKVTCSARAGHRIGEPFGAMRFSVELKNDDGTSTNPATSTEMYLRSDGQLTVNGAQMANTSRNQTWTGVQTFGDGNQSGVGNTIYLTGKTYPSLQWVCTDTTSGYNTQVGSRLCIEINASSPYVVLRKATGDSTGQVLINFPKTSKGQFATEATCDIRFKRDIQDYDGVQSLTNIDAMELKTYIFTDDEQNRVRRGVIAQQLETIDNEYVKDVYQQDDQGNDDTLKVLDSNTLMLDMLAAIQVLSRRVKELESASK